MSEKTRATRYRPSRRPTSHPILPCALILLVCQSLASCATPVSAKPQANNPPTPVPAIGTDAWVLIAPPLEGYSSDRTPQMGGPLALPSDWESRSGAGYKFVNIDRIDANAPLSRWQKRHTFPSESECQDYKAAMLKELSDPAWTTKAALNRRDRIMDPVFVKAFVTAARCVSADQLTPR